MGIDLAGPIFNFYTMTGLIFVSACLGQRKGTNMIEVPYAFPTPMRASPVIQTTSLSWAAASPTGNQVAYYDPVSATWLVGTGTVAINTAVPPSPTALVLRFQGSTAISGAAGSVGQLYLGSTAVIALQAEL